MKHWKWSRGVDGDGHVFWLGIGPRDERGTVWRGGGDSGQFVTEFPNGGRFGSLIEAKRAVEIYFAEGDLW